MIFEIGPDPVVLRIEQGGVLMDIGYSIPFHVFALFLTNFSFCLLINIDEPMKSSATTISGEKNFGSAYFRL